MIWVNFLHIYQPPTQSREIVDRVVRESYRLILELLARYPRLRLTVNMSGSLLELLAQYGHEDVIDGFKSFAMAGRIELVGSAMYHPIMPLVSVAEMKRQIELQNEICRRYFGDVYRPRGFFLPEMAYSEVVGRVVKELGFEWIILDEIHAASPVDSSTRYSIEGVGLGVVFRNTEISKTFPPEYIVNNLDKMPGVVVTAHDGELYGHWHQDDHGFYEKAFTAPGIEMKTVSEYLGGLKDTKEVKVRAASWESTEVELAAGNPFALWNAPDNETHQKLWKLARTAESIVTAHPDDDHARGAERTLGKGLASCAWWWASGRKIGPWSPVSWNPTEIEKGARLLVEAVRSLKAIPSDERLAAEKNFSALHLLAWRKHWEG